MKTLDSLLLVIQAKGLATKSDIYLYIYCY